MFILGGIHKRIGRDVASSQKESGGNASTLYIPTKRTSPTHPQPSTPALNDEDINITIHCEGYWFSCRGRCTQERQLGIREERLQCFCDVSCELFQDCCADFDQYCSSSGISSQEAENPENEQWKCIRSESFSEAFGVWMISSCPRNWTSADIKERCASSRVPLYYSNHKDNLPVIDQNGNTYKNHYCAECNGITLTEVQSYNLQFGCDSPIPNEYGRNEIVKYLFNSCGQPYWQPPEGAARRYCHSVRSNDYCSDNSVSAKVQQKCLNGSLRIVFQDGLIPRNFFNQYCALCSYVKEFRCGPGPFKSGGDISLAKPFSLVMDLDISDSGAEETKVRKLKISCRERHVYDFYLQACRPGLNPSDVTFARSKIFSVNVWMRSMFAGWPWSPLVTESNFKKAIANKLNINETVVFVMDIGNPLGPVTNVIFNVNINPAIQNNISARTMNLTMDTLSVVLNGAKFTFFKVSVKPFQCTVIETYHPNEYEFEGNSVKIIDTGEVFQEANFYTNETEWINGSLVPVGILSVWKLKQPPMNCSGIFVGLTEDEYIILSNGSLYRNISRELFQLGSFHLINETMWVCANFSQMYGERFTNVGGSSAQDDIILVLLTYVGLSLSIVCFVLVLVTFTIFKELRTLPGIYLMNLCLAHLLANLVYLATGYVDAEVACKIIAVLLHCFFLVSFMWMSIIAFETWHVFSKIRVQHKSPNKRERCCTLLRRIALGWLGPFIFILVCVALDQSNAVVFQYGSVKGCWINSTYANLLFFVLPVALSLSVNSVFFCLDCKSHQTDQQTDAKSHTSSTEPPNYSRFS